MKNILTLKEEKKSQREKNKQNGKKYTRKTLNEVKKNYDEVKG